MDVCVYVTYVSRFPSWISFAWRRTESGWGRLLHSYPAHVSYIKSISATQISYHFRDGSHQWKENQSQDFDSCEARKPSLGAIWLDNHHGPDSSWTDSRVGCNGWRGRAKKQSKQFFKPLNWRKKADIRWETIPNITCDFLYLDSLRIEVQ